ncbi:MAG: hypothetical protein Q7S27_03605 [Nanoarchaeota archaeon]|nr:hypothetical protein [Nanoarchaeota archaeon]
MEKPEYVYHGSARELEGDKLIPNKATDLGDKPHNLLEGVYASDVKEQAIAMGILSCKGVGSSSCGVHRKYNPKVEAIIYEGWPEQDYFYLYTLSSETFESKPRGSHQYVSLVSVKPKKIERLLVKNYIHLVRKATDTEKDKWTEKFAHKLRK